jgi:hypothetical protein
MTPSIPSEKLYKFSFLIFKHLLLKDLSITNYIDLVEYYNMNLYSNIKECRFYYIYYFIMLRAQLYEFMDFFYSGIRRIEEKEILVDD